VKKERPILFSGPMVRAILENRKTQTRRVVKCPIWMTKEVDMLNPASPHHYGDVSTIKPCPYGQPGDHLWVRESWNVSGLAFLRKPRETAFAAPSAWKYQATDDGSWQRGWRPSIHMPRWASRILLEIVSVRVERLQDISEEDALAEGVDFHCTDPTCLICHGFCGIQCYRELWEKINGTGSWDANPWVWVVEFKRIGGVA